MQYGGGGEEKKSEQLCDKTASSKADSLIISLSLPPPLLLTEGVCEIWLTSEDTGAYGRDIGTDLPTLLWKLVEVIPEGSMLRLGMTNPPYILEHLEVRSKGGTVRVT